MSSLYGKGLWGAGLYSQVSTWSLGGNLTPAVTFSADADVVGQVFFAGVLAPTVTFAGALSVILDLHGAFTPSVALGADLTFDLILGGSIATQAALGGSLAVDVGFAGDLPVQATIACPELISGPLWADSEICSSPPWAPSESCPPPMWTPIPPPTFVIPSGGWKKQEKAADDVPVWRDAAK